MSSSTTRYTARFQLPELLERGRNEPIQCPVYRDGQLVSPSSGTVSVYDARGNAIVLAQAVTVTGSVATYTVQASAIPTTLQLEDNWRVEWSLTMPDGVVHLFRNDAALVKYRLYPTIADADLIRRVRALDPTSSTAITAVANYQPAIDEADVEVQNRLIALQRRPYLVATPSALREVWLTTTIAIVLEDLAIRNEAYREPAKTWRERVEAAWTAARPQLDYDQDGTATGAHVAVKPGAVWLA